MMSSNETVKSVERAFQILNCFSKEHPELGITELSKKLKTSKSTMHRLLNSMREQGFITQNQVTQRYSPGYGFVRLAEIVLANSDIRKTALPFLKELRNVTGETAGLNIRSENNRVCIEKAESFYDLRRFIEIGRSLPLYAGASGKVILAFQEEQFIDDLIDKGLQAFTSKTITDPLELRKQLSEIRANGYCVTYGEYAAEAVSISAPIINHQNNIIASINVSGPSFRFSPEQIEANISFVKSTAETISQKIGCLSYY